MTPLLIDRPEQLAERAELWRQRPWLTVDTEFVRVDTYYARLCLVQVSDGEFSDCVDTLALTDLAPLHAMLADARILKVFHAAAQDLEILLQTGGACPQPLFDTQVAASLLGIGDQIGYAGLIEKLAGVTIDKSLSRTDWARRPLSAAELAYAGADVLHLAHVYPGLHDRLAEAGRLGWLAQDCARMADPALYRTDPDAAWRRLKGIARLPARGQQVAARLAAWREAEAIARNRPRKWILEDEAIYRIADRQPQSLAQLEALNVLPPRSLQRLGEALLGVVRAALEGDAVALASDEQLGAAQKAALQKLQEHARAIAAQLNVPPTFLAARADLLELLLRGPEAQTALLQGWRREVAGEELLKRVAG